MEQLSAIESYLQTLEFKKKGIGGCDEEDVFLKIKGLSELYQAEIDRLLKRASDAEARTAEYERRSHEVRQLMVAAQNMKDSMLAKALIDSQELVGMADQRARDIVDGAADDAEDIVEQAQAEAALILSEAELKANDICKQAHAEADTKQADAKRAVSELAEQEKQMRADIKRGIDTSYAKAKVAKDKLESVLDVLTDIQSGSSSL